MQDITTAPTCAGCPGVAIDVALAFSFHRATSDRTVTRVVLQPLSSRFRSADIWPDAEVSARSLAGFLFGSTSGPRAGYLAYEGLTRSRARRAVARRPVTAGRPTGRSAPVPESSEAFPRHADRSRTVGRRKRGRCSLRAPDPAFPGGPIHDLRPEPRDRIWRPRRLWPADAAPSRMSLSELRVHRHPFHLSYPPTSEPWRRVCDV